MRHITMGRFKSVHAIAGGCLALSIIGAGAGLSTATVQAAQHTARSSGHFQAHRAAAKSCPAKNKPAGVITFSDRQFPDTLNPYQYSQPIARQILNAMLDNLFQYDDHARLVPQMASVIPTLANGGIKDAGKTIVLRLKPGLRWSNGAEITSHDIKFGWQVGMDSATGPACQGSCDLIKSIDTPSRSIAILHLHRIDSSAIPGALPQVWPPVWPGAWKNNAHAAAVKLGSDPNYTFEGSRYPTNGAYQVSKVVAGSSITLRPMPYYSGATCGSRVRNLVFHAYKSIARMIKAAAAHQTDITTNYNLPDVPDLAKHLSAYRVHIQTSFALEHLEFNVDRTYHGQLNPLANTDVRLALALALDKYALIRQGLTVGASAAQQMAAWSPFVDTGDLKQPFVTSHLTGQWDPIAHSYVIPGTRTALAHARTLLARTPFKKGFTLDLYTTVGSPTRQAQEATIATSWQKVGVTVAPNYVSSDELLGSWSQNGSIARGNFQVAMFSYVGSPEPQDYKYNLQSRYCDRTAKVHSTLNGNGSCVRNTSIDRSFAAAARTFNAGARASDYATVERAVNQRAYWVPLYFRKTVSTDNGRVANFSNSPTLSGPTWNIYAWKIRP